MKVENVTYTGASVVEQKILGLKDSSNGPADQVSVVQGHTQGLSDKSVDSEVSAQGDVYNVSKPLKGGDGNRGE
jgi:hypothetical protein